MESFLDNAIFSVIGTLDNLSSSLNLHSQLLQKVLDYLNDQFVFSFFLSFSFFVFLVF